MTLHVIFDPKRGPRRCVRLAIADPTLDAKPPRILIVGDGWEISPQRHGHYQAHVRSLAAMSLEARFKYFTTRFGAYAFMKPSRDEWLFATIDHLVPPSYLVDMRLRATTPEQHHLLVRLERLFGFSTAASSQAHQHRPSAASRAEAFLRQLFTEARRHPQQFVVAEARRLRIASPATLREIALRLGITSVPVHRDDGRRGIARWDWQLQERQHAA